MAISGNARDRAMIFRLAQKLAQKIDAGKLTESPLDDNPYADWSCHLFTADRTQYIILSHGRRSSGWLMNTVMAVQEEDR